MVDGRTSESGEDLETQKNKKCNQTMYFCVCIYTNYFIKIIYVVYVSVISNSIKYDNHKKQCSKKSNVQKKNNRK